MTYNPTDKHSLTVYKASAGSGKTYTLSIEYIKLLIIQPQCYRKILAVTFTNKATEEMKIRILSQLYGIWKLLPDSRNYIDRITKDLDISESIASKQAGIALHNIIHDYSYFRIETIDSFFQGVLNNLARELDLTANLRVELNDYQIEQYAVDKLIEELHKKDELLKWILSYVKENIEDNKNWNVIGKIKKFGENIFRDYYKANSSRLNEVLQDKEKLHRFIDSLKTIRQRMKNAMKEQCERFNSIMSSSGIEINDLAYGKSGACGYFIKLSESQFDGSILTKRVQSVIDSPDKWLKKGGKDKSRQSLLENVVNNKLWPLLVETERLRSDLWKPYKSAELTLQHINQLRLLNSIENKVKELNADVNRFLLSDTQFLLHSLINDSDSPFIFEKIGTQLEYVMIDEFQDTSTIQWSNFKILLEECMSRSSEGNLIVGDVKQSIYRWRSGDWRLLNNIESQFTDAERRMSIKTLDTNYRSSRRIIEFNNIFFNTAAKIEYDNQYNESADDRLARQLAWAYSDVAQKIPEKTKDEGFVDVELLPREDYQEKTLLRIKEIIDDLISKDVPQNRIAIIVRSNINAQLIAEYFSQYAGYIKIVSEDAFKIESSVAVNIIINAMRLLLNPDNDIAKAYLVKAYRNKIQHKEITDDAYAETHMSDEESLPADFVDQRTHLLTKSLYDIVEHIFISFRLHELNEESAYICMFYDLLRNFIKDNTPDLDAFIEEWENSIHDKTIQANEIDGVRLITIHKSKGLEFDNVIIPFCDWKVNDSGTIWCYPQEAPFNTLPVIPIDYSPKQMKGTIYENDYLNEYLQNTVDNLNLLYVAFTRASDNLFVIGKRNSPQLRSFIIEKSLAAVAEHLPDSSYECDDDSSSPITFHYGNTCIPKRNDVRESSRNVFMQPVLQTETDIDTYICKAEFRQSNKSRDFIEGDDDDSRKRYIRLGSVLHKLFSTINTADDIDNALLRMEYEGVTYDCGMTVDEIRKLLTQRLSSPQVAEWFSGRWKLFNECTILSYDEEKHATVSHRPDRVMTDGRQMIIVDFKFGNPKPEYNRQVREYITLVSQMGYKNVKGYLWFVYSNKIVEVK